MQNQSRLDFSRRQPMTRYIDNIYRKEYCQSAQNDRSDVMTDRQHVLWSKYTHAHHAQLRLRYKTDQGMATQVANQQRVK